MAGFWVWRLKDDLKSAKSSSREVHGGLLNYSGRVQALSSMRSVKKCWKGPGMSIKHVSVGFLGTNNVKLPKLIVTPKSLYIGYAGLFCLHQSTAVRVRSFL